MVLDRGGGGWEDASQLLPVEDPLFKAEFAAEESELEVIASRREALAQLKKSRANLKKDE